MMTVQCAKCGRVVFVEGQPMPKQLCLPCKARAASEVHDVKDEQND